MEEQTKYNELAIDYGLNYDEVVSYANILKCYDFVSNGEPELFYYCLELLLQGISSMHFMDETKDGDGYMPVDYMLADALYKTYGDLSMPYLDEEYLNMNISRM